MGKDSDRELPFQDESEVIRVFPDGLHGAVRPAADLLPGICDRGIDKGDLDQRSKRTVGEW